MLARPWARAVAAVTSTLWASVSGRVVRLQLRPLHLGKSGMRGDIRCFRSDVHRLPTTPVDLGRRAFGAGGAVCDHWRAVALWFDAQRIHSSYSRVLQRRKK